MPLTGRGIDYVFSVKPAESVEMQQDMRSWRVKFQCIANVEQRVKNLIDVENDPNDPTKLKMTGAL